jgi:hydroxymethylbilane synthase
LARVQTDLVADALAAARPALAAPGALEVVVIRTTGDRVVDRPLAEIGGKGLFCKELETALLERRIDLAVHSIKDLPTWLPRGLVLAAALERADPRDALIARGGPTLEQLAPGAVVGTTSPRRRAQLLARRPDLAVVDFRGNVQTRLEKLDQGQADATLLAMAGLRRLGIAGIDLAPLEPEVMLPAVGQGAIGIECRAGDQALLELLAAIDHRPTSIAVAAERACLDALDGSCHTPIGSHATLDGERLHLRALLARPDGGQLWRAERQGAIADAARLGRDAGLELRADAGDAWLG